MSEGDEPTARRGKIARLPATVREELNLRLHNGEVGSRILAWLNSLPETLTVLDLHFNEEPVSPNNLSEWRRGGYQDWLRRRDQVDTMKVLSQHALKMAEAAGASVSDGAAAIAGGRILELLESANQMDLVELSMALGKLRDADAKMLRARISVRQADQKDEQLELDRLKFQRTTAELFLKFYEDKQAKEIAAGSEPKEIKMDLLIKHMFGERPDNLPQPPVSDPAATGAAHFPE